MVSQSFIPIQKTSQRPTTTAHLAQTMTLLGLNNLELLEKIQGELANNPALELIDDYRCPTCKRRISKNQLCIFCSYGNNPDLDAPIIFVSSRRDFNNSTYLNPEDIPEDNYSVQKEDLPTYVLKQVATEISSEERILAAHILTGLDEDGLLTTPLEEIARYHHVPFSKVQGVAKLIQRCDPIGVSASSPKEALLVQLSTIKDRHDIDPLLEKAIEVGLDLISRKQYTDLGKLLDVNTQKAEKLAKFISDNLNPFPARAHWGNIRHQSDTITERYRKPDVIIHAQGDKNNPQLIVEIIWPIHGSLKINKDFQKIISELPSDKAKNWNQALEQANLLIKCLNQRNHTLVQLMQILSTLQRDFILQGDTHLKPTTRAKIAKDIGVHESTISRAVSSKTLQLPSGHIIPISKFFDRSLHIRTTMKLIIDNEAVPLSDTKIAKLLSKKGYNIARRTVAKYRAMEGILPAHLRN
ncbi:hypothetical protein ACFLYP_03155 [Chloroflexota bacterium]